MEEKKKLSDALIANLEERFRRASWIFEWALGLSTYRSEAKGAVDEARDSLQAAIQIVNSFCRVEAPPIKEERCPDCGSDLFEPARTVRVVEGRIHHDRLINTYWPNAVLTGKPGEWKSWQPEDGEVYHCQQCGILFSIKEG